MRLDEGVKLMHDTYTVNWHEHFWSKDEYFKFIDEERSDLAMASMDKFGVDLNVMSLPVNTIKRCPPEIFISANNMINDGVKRYPGKVVGMAYVHPGYTKEALHEIDRCVQDLGFIGVKLYYDYTMDDPVYRPIIEKCIDLDIPILQHSMRFMDPPNRLRQPLASDGYHMAKAAREYPEATFIMGHFTIAEWEWSLKAIKDCPNVYTDMSGSVFDRPQIERAVEMLGANRVLYGTDGSPSACAGKLIGAEISVEDKKKILRGDDLLRFLNRK